ncbi:MAG: 8-oxo-dGTP diphosphatase MutT [Micavibrio sp.]|nr:8-oxo-dGTP diphosphatase MutT [Micavibrio sp.]|tara:strand:+ start:100 stop:549 length:450 start_codon:yes stop_codon:yes gene_type:complete
MSCCGQDIPEHLPPSPNKKIIMVVAAALIDSENKILITQRPEGKAMAGLWEFPGGKIEDGETPEYALCRELREELGVRTNENCLYPLTFASHSYPDFQLLMPLYVLRQWEGTPILKEHAAMQWVNAIDLYKYPMPEADKPLIPALIEYL